MLHHKEEIRYVKLKRYIAVKLNTELIYTLYLYLYFYPGSGYSKVKVLIPFKNVCWFKMTSDRLLIDDGYDYKDVLYYTISTDTIHNMIYLLMYLILFQ